MINLLVASCIHKILNNHSGGLKMVTLVTELYISLREIGQEKLEICSLFDTLEAMEDIEILKYTWNGKVKEFVYMKEE